MKAAPLSKKQEKSLCLLIVALVSEIKNYCNIIERKSNGTQFVKFDLHIHTPASYDFVMDKRKSEEENYLSLINDAIAENIKLIAITDHNTFNGYKVLHLV